MQSSRLSIGTTWSGEETLQFTTLDGGTTQTHRFRVSHRIVGKSGELWTAEISTRLIETIIDDTHIPPLKAEEPAVSKEFLSPKGFLMYTEPFDNAAFGIERLLHFWMPAESNKSWNVSLGTTDERIVTTASAQFSSKPPVKSGVSSFFMKFEETNSFTSTGMMSFDPGSGRLMLADLNVRNAFMPGGVVRANLKLSYRDTTLAGK